MSTCEGPGPDSTDDSEEHSSYEEYSDDEPYCSKHHEYEVPECFCGKEAKFRISGTDKNWMRPFFNCPKRNFSRQCGFFKWEDELFKSDNDQSSKEYNYVCDECLEREREIKSAKVDDKASLDRAKLEPSQQLKSPETESLHIKKRIKDEMVDDMPLLGKVKDEPLIQDGDGSGDVSDSVCKRCRKLKCKFAEVKSEKGDDKASCVKEKLEVLTKLESGHEISAELSLYPNSKKKRYDGAGNLVVGSRVMESNGVDIQQMCLNVGGNNTNDNQKMFIKQEKHGEFETPNLQLVPQVGYVAGPGQAVVEVFALHKKAEECSTDQENGNFVMEHEFFPVCSINKEDELNIKSADESVMMRKGNYYSEKDHHEICLGIAAGAPSSIDLSLKLSYG